MKKLMVSMVLTVLTVGGLWAQQQVKPANNQQSSTMSGVTEVQSVQYAHISKTLTVFGWSVLELLDKSPV